VGLLKREWIGIDVTHLAIALIERRLKEAFPGIAYEVHGVPMPGRATLPYVTSTSFKSGSPRRLGRSLIKRARKEWIAA
jgi:hypothetical protein